MSPGLDVQRASYRDLSRGRQLLSPDRIYELKLENLITSNMFPQGHRVRLQISVASLRIFPVTFKVENLK